MTRFLWSLTLSVWTVSCTTGPSGAGCQAPIQDACTQKAQDVSVELSKIASQQGMSESEITTEFVNACTAQLQHDLDETLTGLQAAVTNDSGTTVTVQKDSSQ